MLYARQNSINVKESGTSDVQVGANYTVMVCPVGGKVSKTTASSTTHKIYRSHGFRLNSNGTEDDKFIVLKTDGTIDVSLYAAITAIDHGADSDEDTITTSVALSLTKGDILINIGPDTGGTPNYDGLRAATLRLLTYSDPDGKEDPQTNATFTADASGNYRYWTPTSKVWELIFDSSSTPVDAITAVPLASNLNGRARFNLMDFGAVSNDAAFDNYEAIRAWIWAGLTWNNRERVPGAELYAPAGIYYVNTTAAFNSYDLGAGDFDVDANIHGLHFMGDGRKATIFRFVDSPATEMWFMDNDSGETIGNNFTFNRMSFWGRDPRNSSDTGKTETDLSANANGFRVYSDGGPNNTKGDSKKFTWTNCDFSMLTLGHSFTGDQTCSEMGFVDCQWWKSGTCYHLDNEQTVNHNFYNCHMEEIWTAIFSVGAEGGGNVNVFGGSIIPRDDVSTGAPLIDATTAGGSKPTHQPWNFWGVAFELRETTILFDIDDNTFGNYHINFHGCKFLSNHTEDAQSNPADKTIAKLSGNCQTMFRSCEFREQRDSSTGTFGRMLFEIGHNGNSTTAGVPGRFVFDDCSWTTFSTSDEFTDADAATISNDLSDRFTNHASSANTGRYIFRGSNGPRSGNNALVKMPGNWNKNGLNPGSNEAWVEWQYTSLIGSNQAWPLASGNVFQTVLPPGAHIKRIFGFKPSASGDGGTYRITVSNDDETTEYAASAWHTHTSATHIDEEVNVIVTSDNDRTLRTLGEGSASTEQGDGYLVVQWG